MKPTKLSLAEHSVVKYYHCADFGETIETVTEPTYWTHVAKSLRTGHHIEIIAADGSWWADLLVRAVGSHDAVVQALQFVELGEPVQAETSESPYEIKWRGPARKFGVIRKADKEVLRDEFDVREKAEKWLKNHMQSLAA